MAHFIPFDDKVEVKGEAILSIVNAFLSKEEAMREILQRNGISDLKEGEWYSQVNYLNGYKEIGETFGPATLFRIGTVIPDNAIFPPDIDSLEKALHSIDVAYNINHRNGDIGYYKLLSFDNENRKAVMECKNPYHSTFDRGLILAMLIRFMPKDSTNFDVVLDKTKETRLDGGGSCTYDIHW